MSFLRVKDDRLNTNSLADAKYIVKEGPIASYTVIPPQNLSTNGSLVYQLNNVGPNVGRNRCIWLNPQLTVVLNGTGLSAPTAGQLGLKCFPFNRNVTSVQHTLNNASDTYLTNQLIDWLARIKTEACCIQGYDNTQPDNCIDYLTGISNLSPITSYTSNVNGDTYKPRNVGIVSATVNGGGTALTIQLNFWEPLISCFSCLPENNKNLPCIYSIDGETISLVSNGFTDLLAYNPAIGTVTSQTVTLNSCNMHVEYITAANPGLVLPESSIYQYPKFQRFQSQITSGTLAPSQNQNVTVQVNAQTVPSKVVVFIRAPEAQRNGTTPDCYASINSVVVQLDNGNTVLNAASPRKLYDISRQNGLATDTFPMWSQYNLAGVTGGSYYGSGSVLVLDPAKDLSISNQMLTNSSAGKYTMNFTINYSNVQNIAQATCFVFTINDSLLMRTGRAYETKLLSYSQEEVANAKRDANFIELSEYEEAKMNNLFLSGGSFKSVFKKLWDNREKIKEGIHHAKKAYEVGKQAYHVGKQIHSAVKNKGGYTSGGYTSGGAMEDEDMRMYYE
jgi:hypothetical protein